MAALQSPSLDSRDVRFAARAAYALAALTILLPAADITLGLFPLQFDNIRWRIGVTGLTTGALLFPITGLFLALATAHFMEHRRVRLTLGIFALIIGITLVATAAMFTLDTLQLRTEVDPRARHMYDRAAGKGVLAQLFTAAMLVFVAISSLRAQRGEKERRKQAAHVGVVGKGAVTE